VFCLTNVPVNIQTRLLPEQVVIRFTGDALLGDHLKCFGMQTNVVPTYIHQIMHIIYGKKYRTNANSNKMESF
jgi:hypothetical protein